MWVAYGIIRKDVWNFIILYGSFLVVLKTFYRYTLRRLRVVI